MIFEVVDLVTGRWTVPALLALTIALAIGCVIARIKNEAARRSGVNAGISPLWLLVPSGAMFFTSPLGTDLAGLNFVVDFF